MVPPRSTERWKWALAVLLIWAAVLRLGIAVRDLDGGRYWDERYGFENVLAVLEGDLLPANGFHPTLSYLPHAVVLAGFEAAAGLTGDSRLEIRDGDRIKPLGYLLARLVQVAVAVASLWLVFAIGRRIAGPATGVWAAFLLSVVPWHIRQSTIFKPDVELLAAMLLAVLWSLRAAESGRLRSYALAGAGYGLAVACKYNAAPMILPFLVSILWPRLSGSGDSGSAPGSKKRRQRLIVTVVAAGGVAAALNYGLLIEPELIERDFGRTLRDYGRKGMDLNAGAVALHAVTSLLDSRFHGVWIGGAACLAWLWLIVRTIREPSSRSAGVLLVGIPLVYLLVYLAMTSNASEHNWLPLVPFTSLALALAGKALWSARRRHRRQRWLLAGLASVAVIWTASSATQYSWKAALPVAGDLVEERLLPRLDPVDQRFVIYELSLFDRGDWMRIKQGRVRSAALGVEKLVEDSQRLPGPAPNFEASPWDRLDLADAEVFAEPRLEGPEAFAYRQRLETGSVLGIGDSWWQARGPAARVVLHPWRRIGERQTIALTRSSADRTVWPFTLSGRGEGGTEPEVMSLTVRLKRPNTIQGEMSLEVDGRPLLLLPTGRRHGDDLYLSERFLAGSRAVESRLHLDVRFDRQERVAIDVLRWLPPG